MAQADASSTHSLPVALGAFPAPPSGPGTGQLALWNTRWSAVSNFGKPSSTSGNSFYVAVDARQELVYIPTAGGTTQIFSLRTRKVVGQFSSLPGGRVARLVPNHRELLVLSGTQLAMYSTVAPYRILFQDAVGGNAIALNPSGQVAYVGGNMDSSVYAVSLVNGKILHQYPVRRSGDLVWARGQVFSADIKTGVMSIIHVRTGKIMRVSTPEVDPAFQYSDIPAATAGFMQLAVSPNQHWVYAAGFSGHILKFSAFRDQYVGEVVVAVPTLGAKKLSGLAVLRGGHEALVTVENLMETALVNLTTGRVIQIVPHLASNRWVVWPAGSRR